MDKEEKSCALHANLSDNNGSDALKSHYNELIIKGLDTTKIKLVVTDMLPAYGGVIKELFPNALHQYCIFHFIQHFNKIFKAALLTHRQATFEEGERKSAHKISFLLLKGQEKLDDTERETVLDFCDDPTDKRFLKNMF